MFRFHTFFFLLVVLTLSALSSACGPLLQPVRVEGGPLPPVVQYEGGGTENPDVFVDVQLFQAALLEALQSRDEAKLDLWMADSFASGVWRGEMAYLSRADALRELLQDQLGESVQLSPAAGVDLPALMGGINPLDIPRPESNVIDAIVVSGWGKGGEDEAILYISRQPDNALRWAGTLVIKGGFGLGGKDGTQQFVSARHGYQAWLPAGYEVDQTMPGETIILAPQGTQGHRERAFISVEPANGRTAAQMAAEMKADQPGEFAGQDILSIPLDTEMAMSLDRVPSQSIMRVLFVVHEDRLYKLIFIPNDQQEGEAYNQMRELYAAVVNTFKFIPVEGANPPGGKLVAEMDVFVNLLQQALAGRDKVALQSLMGEQFELGTWKVQEAPALITPGEAVEQALNNWVPVGAQPVIDTDDPIIGLFFADPRSNQAGDPLTSVHVSGWGLEGKDEAILTIARRSDGSLYWSGALTALGGF